MARPKKIDKKEEGVTMTISGESPAQETLAEKSALKKFSDEFNEKVEQSNNVRSLNSHYQEVPPAYSPKEVPVGSVSWTPASILTVTGKRPDFHYVWVENKPESINRAIMEQHEIDTDPQVCASAMGSKQYQMPNGDVLNNVKIRGDLILMRMPKVVHEARRAYMKAKQKGASDVAREIAQQHNGQGNNLGRINGEISTEKVVEKI